MAGKCASKRPCRLISKEFCGISRLICQAVNHTLILTGPFQSCITFWSKRRMPCFDGRVRFRRSRFGVGHRDLKSQPASRLASVTFIPWSCARAGQAQVV
jgi:hypothetical protein